MLFSEAGLQSAPEILHQDHCPGGPGGPGGPGVSVLESVAAEALVAPSASECTPEHLHRYL